MTLPNPDNPQPTPDPIPSPERRGGLLGKIFKRKSTPPPEPVAPPRTLEQMAGQSPVAPEPVRVEPRRAEFPRFSHFEIPTAEVTGDPDVDRIITSARERTLSTAEDPRERDRINNMYREDLFNARQKLDGQIAATTDDAEKERLIRAKQELNARYVQVDTVVRAGEFFKPLRAGEARPNVVVIAIDLGNTEGHIFLNDLPGMLSPTDGITFLERYAQSSEYQELKTRMGNGEKYDQSLGLFIAEMGKRLRESPPPGYSTQKIQHTQHLLSEGVAHTGTYDAVTGLNRRLDELKVAQNTSDELAQDQTLAGEIASLEQARESIIPTYTRLATRNSASDAVRELQSSRRMGNQIVINWSDGTTLETAGIGLRYGISTPRDLLEALGEYASGEEYGRRREFMGEDFAQFDASLREYGDEVAQGIMREPHHIQPEQVDRILGVLREGGLPDLRKTQIDERIYNLETILQVRGNLPASFQQELNTLRSQRTELVDLYCTVQTQKNAEEAYRQMMRISYGLGQATIHFSLGDTFSAETISTGVFQNPSQMIEQLVAYKTRELPKRRQDMGDEVARNLEKGIDTYITTFTRLQSQPNR